jgi:hypothetical protein
MHRDDLTILHACMIRQMPIKSTHSNALAHINSPRKLHTHALTQVSISRPSSSSASPPFPNSTAKFSDRTFAPNQSEARRAYVNRTLFSCQMFMSLSFMLLMGKVSFLWSCRTCACSCIPNLFAWCDCLSSSLNSHPMLLFIFDRDLSHYIHTIQSSRTSIHSTSSSLTRTLRSPSWP